MSQGGRDDPTRIVVAQRIRNRIMDCLELFSSYEEQLEHQRVAPVHVPDQIINMWEDWVGGDSLDWFAEPVFSEQEQLAIREFHATWQRVCDMTPKHLPDLSKLIGTDPWEQLRLGAEAALKVFAARGRLDEDREETPE